MTEYVKRELALNSTFSRLFWEEVTIYRTTNDVAQTVTGRYLYQGAGILQVQQIYLIGLSNTYGFVGDLGVQIAYTYKLQTLNGYVIKEPNVWGDQLFSMNQSYDNADHVPLLTNNDGYVVHVNQSAPIPTYNNGATFRLGVIGIEYLD